MVIVNSKEKWSSLQKVMRTTHFVYLQMLSDVNKHPKAVIKPPMTAETRVDFLRQIPIIKGDKKCVTAREKVVSQSGKKRRRKYDNF